MEWIKVSEQLPEMFERVLLSDGTEVREGEYDPGYKLPFRYGPEGAFTIYATHWMPLPAPPEDE